MGTSAHFTDRDFQFKLIVDRLEIWMKILFLYVKYHRESEKWDNRLVFLRQFVVHKFASKPTCKTIHLEWM